MKNSEQRLLRELAKGLEVALVEAVGSARQKCRGERFYAYILYTLPFYDYAVLLFNTEEGLARIGRTKTLQNELRWSPPDWECSVDAEPPFERANETLRSLLELHGSSESACGKRQTVFVDVLKSLDAKGTFGSGVARESALVNIMWGDQDVVAHIESARILNPKSSYIEYAKHALPSLYASAKEIRASPSMFKDEALARLGRTISQVESDLAEESS